MAAPQWAVGMELLGPGIFVDAAGNFHFDPASFCEHMGVPYTRANHEIAIIAMREAVTITYGDVPTTFVQRAHAETDD
jgi:hypothetical protein